ncbi:MAG: radical SAM protein [Candidatus Methanoperedens sp.]
MQIYIIPTYNCNLECNKCYSKKYTEDFPNYLSWTKFVEIFKFFRSKYNNFAFIGGEPTKWKFINESILFLHNRNKNVAIFTNATIPLKVIPNNLIINGNNIFNPELKDSIIWNLSFYKKKGAKIRLRFNIDEKFEKENIHEAILLSKEFADSVSISILYPIDNSIDYGKIIFDLSKKLYSEYIPVKISRATPLCLFNQEQRDFLISNCKLKGKCSLPTNSLVINPDGQTIQPCVELHIRHNISDLLKTKPKNIFVKDINILKSNRQSTKCSNCNFYSNDECWGGCLSYPLFGAPLNVPPK